MFYELVRHKQIKLWSNNILEIKKNHLIRKSIGKIMQGFLVLIELFNFGLGFFKEEHQFKVLLGSMYELFTIMYHVPCKRQRNN